MRVLLKIFVPSNVFLFLYLAVSIPAFSQNNTIYLKLNSPNGGEKWEANSTQTITWQSSGIAKIKIEYSFSGGMMWHTVASSVDASLGQYSWKVPYIQIAEVLIKISDISHPSIYDVSDKEFSIYIKSSLKKPTGLEKIQGITNSTTIKIMPLGDSITEGEGNDTDYVGYREYLFKSLDSLGYNFQFVGSQQSGLEDIYGLNSPPPGSSDYNFWYYGRHHEGHGGWVAYPFAGFPNVHALSDYLDAYLDLNPPDIVLLHIGTNDVNQNFYGGGNDPLSNGVDTLLKKIYNHNPNTTTFLAKIIDRTDTYDHPGRHDSLLAFNAEVENMYNSLPIDMKTKIKLVDMYSAMGIFKTVNYSSDSLHPSNTGYKIIANKWLDTLRNYLPILQVKVLLQGPYDTSSQEMTTSLRHFYNGQDTVDLLPAISPYKDVNNNNSEYLNDTAHIQVPYSIPMDITDWVQVEIRDTNKTTVVESKSCFLRDDGQIIDPDNLDDNVALGIPPGDYYVVIKHHNHLAIMSARPLELNGITSYDFTTDTTQAYGIDAMASLGNGKYGMIVGDNNNDGVISILDYNSIAKCMSKTGYCIPDDNMSGKVSNLDFKLVSSNLFSYSKVP